MIVTLWPALVASASLQQLLLLHAVRKQDRPRARLVVVELREEGAQHLRRLQRRVGLREIGAVAPVLAGAEEEHLDADLPALLMDGEDVGLLDALRVDALVALHMRQRRQPVAIDRGPLEIEIFGGLLHLRRNLGLHLLAAAGQEILRLRQPARHSPAAAISPVQGPEQRLIW